MKTRLAIVGVLLLLVSISSGAQVTGGQAPPEEKAVAPGPPKVEDIEVQSPLLVQVSLLPTSPRAAALAQLPLDAPRPSEPDSSATRRE